MLKIIAIVTYVGRNDYLQLGERQALMSETETFQCYPFLTLNNFRSKYLLKEAFASILPEGKFVRFRILSSLDYPMFGKLTLYMYK